MQMIDPLTEFYRHLLHSLVVLIQIKQLQKNFIKLKYITINIIIQFVKSCEIFQHVDSLVNINICWSKVLEIMHMIDPLTEFFRQLLQRLDTCDKKPTLSINIYYNKSSNAICEILKDRNPMLA